MIPFIDFKKLHFDIRDEISRSLIETFESGWYILGEKVRGFEKEFSKFCKTDYAISVANGLDALILIFRAYKEMGLLEDGDEVIVPSISINKFGTSKAGASRQHVESTLECISTYFII